MSPHLQQPSRISDTNKRRGNTGLGKEAITQLAKHNPQQIFLAARTASKANDAIADIKKAVPSANVEHLLLDLSSFKSIEAAANTFISKSSKLDILMNNAGIMATPYSTTEEGYEIQFGTNHMGHALLTKLLMPTLLETAKHPDADVRIVNLSSAGHQMCPSDGIIYDPDKLSKEGAWSRYGQAKLANILFTRALAKHYPSITSAAVHPGLIKTELYQHASAGAKFVNIVGVSVPEGTKNQLWAATAKGVKSGEYYTPVGNLSRPFFAKFFTAGAKHMQDEQMADRLWEWTEGELKKHGY